jgi:hypothetical protein
MHFYPCTRITVQPFSRSLFPSDDHAAAGLRIARSGNIAAAFK